jgi:hypothetical protein
MRALCGSLTLVLSLSAIDRLEAQTSDSMPAGHHHTPGMVHGQTDSGFRAMNARGAVAMQVDQSRAIHHFDSLNDGGRIVLESTDGDSAGIAGIRAHFRDIEAAFRAGDFSIPMFVHGEPVPGTDVMAARKALIRYTRTELPRGAELRMRTQDPEALAAIHEFLAYQRRSHHAPGMEQ